MIREAKASELQSVIPMAESFHKMLRLPGVFNGDVFVKTWTELIDGKIGLVATRFKCDTAVEAVGLIRSGDMFSGEITVCSAFWLFTTPPKGLEAGLLYQWVESKAAELGATQLLVSTLKTSPRISAISEFLIKSGFSPVETTYRKAITCHKLYQ